MSNEGHSSLSMSKVVYTWCLSHEDSKASAFFFDFSLSEKTHMRIDNF